VLTPESGVFADGVIGEGLDVALDVVLAPHCI
jgi:hypothetical protein